MSASPVARQVTQSQNIPTKKIIEEADQMPIDYSSTPGGTLYSTTPGGTRIIYERAFLMNLRNSPISQTPPKNMPTIPASILKDSPVMATSPFKSPSPPKAVVPPVDDSTVQFDMDE